MNPVLSATAMRYLTFFATLYVTLICPFVCRTGCGSGAETEDVVVRCGCCEHCRAVSVPTQTDSDEPSLPMGDECVCPCLCNGAIPPEFVGFPDFDLGMSWLPATSVADAHASHGSVVFVLARGEPSNRLSGHDRRIALCSFTC